MIGPHCDAGHSPVGQFPEWAFAATSITPEYAVYERALR